MVLFNEYDTSKLDEALEELNKYFYYIDKDFFRDFDSLREEIKEKYKEYEEEYVLEISGDLAEEEIPFEDSVRMAAEVFESVDPAYRDAFLMMVKDTKYNISYDEEHERSNNSNIVLTGTADDVLVLVHEFAHNFVMVENDCFFLTLFEEINAIFWEKVAIDYMNSKYNTFINYDRVRLTALIKSRTKVLDKIYLDVLSESEKGLDEDGFFKVYSNANITARFFIDSDILFSKLGARTFLIEKYNHDLGFLLANSMYQDYLSNPDTIKKLYDVEKINSSTDDLIEDRLNLLYCDDIPIIHDGKVSLKGNNYERLVTSLHDTIDMWKAKVK